MSAFSLLAAPPNLTVQLQRNKNAPLPCRAKHDIADGLWLAAHRSIKAISYQLFAISYVVLRTTFPSSVDYLAPIIFGALFPTPEGDYSGELLRTL